MLKVYRQLEQGEHILIGGDCSQGGKDYNACIFLSRKHLDIPIVYHKHGVAAQMTSDMLPYFERVHDDTGMQPIIAFEQNNGGISEMERLSVLNRLNKYKLYEMKHFGKVDTTSTTTGKLGYSTNSASRPILLGDLKGAIDKKVLRIFDNEIVKELYQFIVSKNGKPEAEKGMHDDLIFALAIAWQLYQTEREPEISSSPASYQSFIQRNRVLDDDIGI